MHVPKYQQGQAEETPEKLYKAAILRSSVVGRQNPVCGHAWQAVPNRLVQQEL